MEKKTLAKGALALVALRKLVRVAVAVAVLAAVVKVLRRNPA